MSKKAIICKGTREVVCPYCGHEDSDSWELPGDDGEIGETECGECERTFNYYRDITVTYTSMKKEAPQ